MDPYGLRRVVSPAGVLPQRAERLDPDLPLGEDELSLDVEALNVDAASFRQLEAAAGGDPSRIADEVLRIVRARGKLHNPVTGSGGVLVGRVKELGPAHPAARTLRPGERVVTLVSLSLTPLRLERILAVHPETDRVDCRGQAVLFATGLWARLPADLPEPVALAALDVCGAPALARRHLGPGQRVLVLGAGKSGALVAVQARRSVGREGVVVLADRSPEALRALAGLDVDARLVLDAADPLSGLHAVEVAAGPFDLVVGCTSAPGAEMAAILAVRTGGTVILFSMATSFTAAALGAEGVGKDATLIIGNGYAPGHAELALELVRSDGALRAWFEARFGRAGEGRMSTLQVGIYVYPEVEVLDFAGPFEVFSTASRVVLRQRPGAEPPFAVSLISADPGPVRARAGFTVQPDGTLASHPPLDLLLVPGGVHEPELARPEVIGWIARQARTAQLTASVCTGAFLLARAGLLGKLAVTTHWEDVADLRRMFPELEVREGVRWVEHGRILTSAGISAGLDMSLRMVARLAGQELAERTARQMDYEWRQREAAAP